MARHCRLNFYDRVSDDDDIINPWLSVNDAFSPCLSRWCWDSYEQRYQVRACLFSSTPFCTRVTVLTFLEAFNTLRSIRKGYLTNQNFCGAFRGDISSCLPSAAADVPRYRDWLLNFGDRCSQHYRSFVTIATQWRHVSNKTISSVQFHFA